MVLRCVVSLVLHTSGVQVASRGQLDEVQRLCAIGLTRQVRFFSLVMPTGRLVTPASGRGGGRQPQLSSRAGGRSDPAGYSCDGKNPLCMPIPLDLSS